MKQQQKKAARTWVLGHINWYDRRSSQGCIIGDDGIWYRIHEFCEIITSGKGLREKARVKFTLAVDSNHPIVQSVKILEEKRQSPSAEPIVDQPSKLRDL